MFGCCDVLFPWCPHVDCSPNVDPLQMLGHHPGQAMRQHLPRSGLFCASYRVRQCGNIQLALGYFAPPITFPLSASLFCLSCRYFMGRHPYYRIVNMRIILDRGLGWGKQVNRAGERSVEIWRRGVGGNRLQTILVKRSILTRQVGLSGNGDGH